MTPEDHERKHIPRKPWGTAGRLLLLVSLLKGNHERMPRDTADVCSDLLKDDAKITSDFQQLTRIPRDIAYRRSAFRTLENGAHIASGGLKPEFLISARRNS